MKLVYVAGPYRSEKVGGVGANISKAQLMGLTIATSGHKYNLFPVIPHMNTAHFETHAFRVVEMSGGFIEPIDDNYWLQGTMALMEKCDAVLLTHPRAGAVSSGTKAEILRAIELGIPVYAHEGMLFADAREDTIPKRSINALEDLSEFFGDI
ncbi:nucleoside 2-deoxyribosyltransferase [Providencia phage Kokobel1]|uniref:Nucleoside 2-deoxyribosyltransferase n=1 Tax=Providencia phage Kokobel1 TaxID=2783540 RepID=A0A873WRS7_9CAUD|nr:nucleoside 2-deoxyribosyltransferase [Providencia phage Kokobel1]QPB11434.1 hypothetical protein [Providencia phage Kokobel1]